MTKIGTHVAHVSHTWLGYHSRRRHYGN